MSYIEIEEKGLKLEFDRKSIIEMEKMGYNVVNPSEHIYTNFEILVYGSLLKHQPKTTWENAIEIVEYLKEEYGMMEVVKNLNEMVNEIFTLKGKGKKLVRKGK